jgi:hypothetical protein
VILTYLILFIVILILEITFLHIILQFLELKSLAGKPVNSTRDELFLDVLS